jgi:hypothetical protein
MHGFSLSPATAHFAFLTRKKRTNWSQLMRNVLRAMVNFIGFILRRESTAVSYTFTAL